MRRRVHALLLLFASTLSGPLRAQTAAAPATDASSGETLFYEGRSLMAEHRYAEACAVFERAEKAHRTIGVLLNLADCYDQMNRTASARHKFLEAAVASQAANDAREVYARRRAASLESRLLTITLDVAALQRDRLAELRIDGASVDRARWREPIPVDPGLHTIDVRSPAGREWSASVNVTESATVQVPQLAPALGSAESPAPPPTLSDAGAPPSSRFWTARTVAAGSLLTAAAAGVAVGVYFGLQSQKDSDRAALQRSTLSDFDCMGTASSTTGCTALRDAVHAQSRDSAWSIGGYVAAGALATTALALWLLLPGPHDGKASVAFVPVVGPLQGGIRVQGSL